MTLRTLKETPNRCVYRNSGSNCSVSFHKVSLYSRSKLKLSHASFVVDLIVMKNLMQGMTRPCICDFKLGSQAYNPVKLERQRWKASSSTSGELSFRLCGVSYFNLDNEGGVSEDME